MFFTVKQYSHIRDRTCVSPSTPHASLCFRLPVFVVWCGVVGHKSALLGSLSVVKSKAPCSSGRVPLIFVPLLGLLLPSQTIHGSQWWFLSYVCWSNMHSFSCYLLISSPASAQLATHGDVTRWFVNSCFEASSLKPIILNTLYRCSNAYQWLIFFFYVN